MSTHSTKRKQILLALMGLFFLLLGLIAWMEMDQFRPAAQTSTNINSIIIKRADHEDISLIKTGAVWHMTTPYKLVANAQRIDPLLSLGSATFDGYEKSEVDLPATGLTAPAASVTLGAREFLLGEPDVGGERRYTLVDDKVSFVPAWVWSLVHGGVTAFSDLTVFTELPNDVYLVQGNETTKLNNVEQWQLLQADKITDWPNDSSQSLVENTDDMSWQLRSTDDNKTAEPLATLLRLDDRTLINTQPGFAFAISNARFDALLNL